MPVSTHAQTARSSPAEAVFPGSSAPNTRIADTRAADTRAADTSAPNTRIAAARIDQSSPTETNARSAQAELEGILITGAGRGLGQAIACHLAKPQRRLWLHYHRSQREIERTVQRVEQRGATAVPLQADLADHAARQTLISAVAADSTPLRILIHNAGKYCETPLLDLQAPLFSEVFEINCIALLDLVQGLRRAAPSAHLSNIVAIGDAAADRITARPHATPYHISKLGLHVLVRSLAVTLGEAGVRINMISPGFLEQSVGTPGKAPPAGRLGQYADILNALDYLLSARAAYVNGANLVVSGGWNI